MLDLKGLLEAAGFEVVDDVVTEEAVVNILDRARKAYIAMKGNTNPRLDNRVVLKGECVMVHSEAPQTALGPHDLVEMLTLNRDGYFGATLTFSTHGDDPEDEYFGVIYRDRPDTEQLRREFYSHIASIGRSTSKVVLLGDPGRHPKVDRVVWDYNHNFRKWLGWTHYKNGKIIPIRI